MEPISTSAVVLPALITAGTQLIGGLLGNKAQQEENRKRRIYEAQQGAYQNQMNAAQNQAKGEQDAFQRMMEAYSRSLT